MLMTTEKGRATRERVLDAARQELVARRGHVEVARVAERAGGSVGLLYRYFPSKGALLEAVLARFFDAMDAQVFDANPVPGADWGTREKARTAQLVRFVYDEPLAPVVLAHLANLPEVAALAHARLMRQVGLAAANIRWGQERGQLPADLDAELTGAMVLGGVRTVLNAVLHQAERPPAGDLVEQLWSFIRALVRYPRESP
jgi:AcrR family transcriptional regulator